ncbi:MAG: MaoC family dehydratase N-terminal domain-containing protein [Kiloniellales bacterium]
MNDTETEKRTGLEWSFAVEWGKAREFARAVYDDHWNDSDFLPPPTFPIYATADFIERLIVEQLRLDRRRIVHGEESFEYLRPLHVGDRLICRARVVEDYVKEGRRGGRMRFIVCEIEMRDAESGELVLRERSTAIETAATEEASS